jgi:hypothetical protein
MQNCHRLASKKIRHDVTADVITVSSICFRQNTNTEDTAERTTTEATGPAADQFLAKTPAGRRLAVTSQTAAFASRTTAPAVE